MRATPCTEAIGTANRVSPIFTNTACVTAKVKGTVGNNTTVRYVDPGTPSAALSVSVTGTAITVNLATGAGTVQAETATVVAASGAKPN